MRIEFGFFFFVIYVEFFLCVSCCVRCRGFKKFVFKLVTVYSRGFRRLGYFWFGKSLLWCGGGGGCGRLCYRIVVSCVFILVNVCFICWFIYFYVLEQKNKYIVLFWFFEIVCIFFGIFLFIIFNILEFYYDFFWLYNNGRSWGRFV